MDIFKDYAETGGKMVKKSIIAFALVMIFLSCTNVKYIVLENVPQSPVITVFPASLSKEDILASNHITELVISCGIKTIERPVMLKERSEYEGAVSGGGLGITGSGQLSIVSGGGTQNAELRSSVDPVGLIKETNADYIFIVQNQAGTPYLKLVKRDSEQILYAGKFDVESQSTCCITGFPSFQNNSRERMRALLEEAGIIK